MRSHIKAIASVICAALAAACAGATTYPQSSPQTLAAASGAPRSAGAPASDVDVRLIKEGYSVRRRHDQVFYCRSTVVTGTLISSRTCLTAAQIADSKQEAVKAKDMLNASGGTECVGNACNGK
jgi:hypothetical protein